MHRNRNGRQRITSCYNFTVKLLTDLALAKKLERAEGGAAAAFTEARGGSSCWAEMGGAYAMFDGAASPVTQTFGLGIYEPATPELLDRIEDFFRQRGAPVHHEICPLAGVPLAITLAQRGYLPCEFSSVMFLELAGRGAGEPLNPALTVRIVGSDDAAVFARTGAEGWREAGDVAHMVEGFMNVMMASRAYVGFLAEKDGEAIAAGGLSIQGSTALFAGASTIPEARNQGAQRAILEARLQHAAGAGCELAVMVAEPGSASQRNAERQGFRIAYTRTKWKLALN